MTKSLIEAAQDALLFLSYLTDVGNEDADTVWKRLDAAIAVETQQPSHASLVAALRDLNAEVKASVKRSKPYARAHGLAVAMDRADELLAQVQQ